LIRFPKFEFTRLQECVRVGRCSLSDKRRPTVMSAVELSYHEHKKQQQWPGWMRQQQQQRSWWTRWWWWWPRPTLHRSASMAKKGLCAALDTNVFDYGQKAAADQMKTSWEKLVQYVGTTHGQDICNELQNKQTVTIAEPTHTAAIMTQHTTHEVMVRRGQRNIHVARRAQETILWADVAAGDLDAPMQLVILQNEIAQASLKLVRRFPLSSVTQRRPCTSMSGAPTESVLPPWPSTKDRLTP